MPRAESAAFAILRRARTVSDSFKEIQPGGGPFGANPALARSVGVPAGSLAPRLVSVVPANGGVCLRILRAEGIANWWCQPTALAARGGLIIGQIQAMCWRTGCGLPPGQNGRNVRSVSSGVPAELSASAASG